MAENNQKPFVLESLEWDNTWIEKTEDETSPRVFYIGDSISVGTRRLGTILSDFHILFDGFASSKAPDNPYLAPSIALFAEQLRRPSAVLFNSGLHGSHLSDDGDYVRCYEELIRFLLDRFAGIPVFLILSTHTLDDKTTARVIARNEEVQKLAEKYQLPVIDLYTVSEGCRDAHSDFVHFNEEGYRKLAGAILDAVRPVLGIKGEKQ